MTDTASDLTFLSDLPLAGHARRHRLRRLDP